METSFRTSFQRRQSTFVFYISYLPTNAQPTDFKNKGGLKQEDLRRRREEQQVEIRRQKREENISKRRNFLPSSGADSDEEVGGVHWDLSVCIPTAYPFSTWFLIR